MRSAGTISGESGFELLDRDRLGCSGRGGATSEALEGADSTFDLGTSVEPWDVVGLFDFLAD
jgi:hypothetical protein